MTVFYWTRSSPPFVIVVLELQYFLPVSHTYMNYLLASSVIIEFFSILVKETDKLSLLSSSA